MSDDTESEADRNLKNAIFAARQAVQGGGNTVIPGQPLPPNRQSAPSNFPQLPTGMAPLPSRGLVYGPGPTHLREDLEIFEMTAVQEDILMNPLFMKKGTTITELIKSSIVDKTVDPNSLISGDRNALMVAIRMTGYGDDYTFEMMCPNERCGEKQEVNVKLSSLPIKFLEVQPLQVGTNQFSFTLPLSKQNVVFKLLTGREEEEILATMEKKKKSGIANSNAVTTGLLYSILSIDGETDRNKIATLIKYMKAGDSRALRQYREKIEPSIEMKFDFECTSCEYEVKEMSLPLGSEFFWPKDRS